MHFHWDSYSSSTTHNKSVRKYHRSQAHVWEWAPSKKHYCFHGIWDFPCIYNRSISHHWQFVASEITMAFPRDLMSMYACIMVLLLMARASFQRRDDAVSQESSSICVLIIVLVLTVDVALPWDITYVSKYFLDVSSYLSLFSTTVSHEKAMVPHSHMC
jgi:hypothetical protein